MKSEVRHVGRVAFPSFSGVRIPLGVMPTGPVLPYRTRQMGHRP